MRAFLLSLLVLAMVPVAAEAGGRDRWGFSFGYSSGGYVGHRYERVRVYEPYCPPPAVIYRPAPVYYAPPPVVIYRPAPVYCPPPVVYYEPAPVYHYRETYTHWEPRYEPRVDFGFRYSRTEYRYGR